MTANGEASLNAVFTDAKLTPQKTTVAVAIK